MHISNNKHILNTPVSEVDNTDPGDDVQLRFRYQHAYGVILLVGIITNKLPYKTIWCEQHEDYLAEKLDNKFDAYQIKTGTPENGKLNLRNITFKDVIKKFLQLHLKFNNKIDNYFIVSNVGYLESESIGKNFRSPKNLINHLLSIQDLSKIDIGFKKEFDLLSKHCNCKKDDLFNLLKRVILSVGPSKESFETEIAHTYIPNLPNCSDLNSIKLNKIRDELIFRIYKASSIAISSPDQYYFVLHEKQLNPKLAIKRINIQDILAFLSELEELPFRYLPSKETLKLGGKKIPLEKLRIKMKMGGVHEDQIDLMEMRAISADSRLIELAYRKPEEINVILNQLQQVVVAECKESFFHYSQHDKLFGTKMLCDLYSRLKEIAKDRKAMVYSEQYECLIGLVGLISNDCKIKWSNESMGLNK